MIDYLNTECQKCQNGIYKEVNLQDSFEGKLTCYHCQNTTPRFQKTEKELAEEKLEEEKLAKDRYDMKCEIEYEGGIAEYFCNYMDINCSKSILTKEEWEAVKQLKNAYDKLEHLSEPTQEEYDKYE